ncbi:MAG: glycosyltransferase [Lachnoclostridium sp.]|nr:glycosyltransferase [Lachnoclostridium sp.]
MKDIKKILIVTYHYLDSVGGGVYASRAYINALANIYPEKGQVTLLYPASDIHPLQGIDPRVKVIPVYYNVSKIRKLYNLLRGKYLRFNKTFKKLIEEDKFELVIFDNSHCSLGLIDIAHKTGAKVITIHHNCELEYVRDNSSRLLYYPSMRITRKGEGDAVRLSDLNLALTPEDVDLLKYHYLVDGKESKFNVLGSFESTSNDSHNITEQKTDNQIKDFVITGNLSNKQSIDSLLPWLKEYYPILLKNFPESTLTIAGKNPSQEIINACRSLGIKLIPNPENMDIILSQADCYICPTSLGGGIKLRIMDGLRNGLPVITHAVSARGYGEFIDRKIMFKYSDPKSFINCCESLKHGHSSKASIQEEYRKIFSFQSGIKRMSEAISKI